jgi:hypothetical protein
MKTSVKKAFPPQLEADRLRTPLKSMPVGRSHAHPQLLLKPSFGQDTGPQRLHSLQQQIGNRRVQRALAVQRQGEDADARDALDPTNLLAWEFFSRDKRRNDFPREYLATLGAAPLAGLRAEQQLELAVRGRGGLSEADLLDKVEQGFGEVVRMTALGLMASHRSTIKGKRDETLAALREGSRAKAQQAQAGHAGEQNEQAGVTYNDIRTASALAASLQQLKPRLEGYRDQLDSIAGGALIRSHSAENIEAWVARIRDCSLEYRTHASTETFNAHIKQLAHTGDMDLAAAGVSTLAMALRNWRQKQIRGVDVALYQTYEAFPFLATTDPQKLSRAGALGDTALLVTVQQAFGKLLYHIDEAIVAIGSEDVHPFDLPQAVDAAKRDLPPQLQDLVQTVVKQHAVNRFWFSFGANLGGVVLAFLPVVGPAIALGLSAAETATSIEGLLDQYLFSDASHQPGDTSLGVQQTHWHDWALVGAGIASNAVSSKTIGMLMFSLQTTLAAHDLVAALPRMSKTADTH